MTITKKNRPGDSPEVGMQCSTALSKAQGTIIRTECARGVRVLIVQETSGAVQAYKKNTSGEWWRCKRGTAKDWVFERGAVADYLSNADRALK